MKCKKASTQRDIQVGQTFGEWTISSLIPGDSINVMCRCSCGVERKVNKYSLIYGKSTGCGHNKNREQIIDISGQTFGEWQVLYRIDNRYYQCRCSCGVERKVLREQLIRGMQQSCGHTKKLKNIIDITGMRFGHLRVDKYLGGNKWLCTCDCGNKTIHYQHNLRRSDTISCGCMDDKPYTKDEILDKIQAFVEINKYKPYRSDLEDMLDRSKTTIQRYIEKYDLYEYLNDEFNQSKPEREIYDMFKEYFNRHNRSVIGMELDLLSKDNKLAIEFNGSYWHSEAFKDKQYHQSKSIQCYKQGIHLIHIFEHEWNNDDTREKLINLIKSSLNIDDPEIIQARKLKIQEIDKQIAFEFLNKYHLQNGMYSEINIGAYHNNQLVGVMTFGAQRFDKTCDYEMHRMCWKTGIVCKGGTERLYRYFEKKYKPQRVISYCDFQKFTGSQYIRLGFKLDHISEPGYVWWKQSGNIVMTRYQSQKQRLIKLGLGTKEKTEDEIMYNQGFIKIYNSGNLVFIRE